MPRSPALAVLAILAFAGVTASAFPASAHGWHRHHHRHHHLHRHHRVWVHDYGPRYRWTSVSLFGLGWGCGLQRFVTKYGALAYREVCY